MTETLPQMRSFPISGLSAGTLRAILPFSWFDDAIVARFFVIGLLLSSSPAHLVDHHVGPFRFDPESFCGVGSVLSEDCL